MAAANIPATTSSKTIPSPPLIFLSKYEIGKGFKKSKNLIIIKATITKKTLSY